MVLMHFDESTVYGDDLIFSISLDRNRSDSKRSHEWHVVSHDAKLAIDSFDDDHRGFAFVYFAFRSDNFQLKSLQ